MNTVMCLQVTVSTCVDVSLGYIPVSAMSQCSGLTTGDQFVTLAELNQHRAEHREFT